MRRTAITLALCAALAAPAAHAQEREDRERPPSASSGGNSELFGRLLGAGVGALLGSQVGGGKGKLAAVAVGALAGAWIGGEVANRLTQSDQQGIARTTSTALETGQPQAWTNPDTGVRTTVAVKDSTVERAPVRSDGLKPRPWETPPLEYVNAWYVARDTSNVRGGPGTEYAVMDTMRRGERVAVVGRVKGGDWYMVADGGLGAGYVHASLLERVAEQPAGESPLYAQARGTRGAPGPERACSVINQEIVLPDGTTESRDIRACRQPDGTWVAV